MNQPDPGTDPDTELSPLLPMEAKSVAQLPTGAGWQYEPKWDGFRCLAVKSSNQVHLYAKSGKPLGRYFPDVVADLAAVAADDFVIDGELVIAIAGGLSFDALQLRLHPAPSRVRKLADETPAMLILFDMLMRPGGRNLLATPLQARRVELERFVADFGGPRLGLSPMTRDIAEAERWLEAAGGALDGVIAKRIDDGYAPGERRMLKVKRIRSADCVVGGFRYGTGSRMVGSLLLGLFDAAGKLDHVGFTATIAAKEKPELTERLEALRGGSGFTGRAPGGPSRWSTERTGEYEPLRHELVVEVAYDHVSGGRFRHGTKLLRWRPDKSPRQCTMEQLQAEAQPGSLVAAVTGQ